MAFQFRPPVNIQPPIFVMVAGGTNTGKSWSSLLIARGMVGPRAKSQCLIPSQGAWRICAGITSLTWT